MAQCSIGIPYAWADKHGDGDYVFCPICCKRMLNKKYTFHYGECERKNGQPTEESKSKAKKLARG
jgi:hypothetical protein